MATRYSSIVNVDRKFMVDYINSIRSVHDQWIIRNHTFSADKLNAFLRHAINTVPYFKAKVSGQQNAPHIEHFPLLRRTDYKDRDNMVSTAVDITKMLWRTTSGTSGVPLTIGYDLVSYYGVVKDGFSCLVERIPNLNLPKLKIGVIMVDDRSDRSGFTVVKPELNDTIFQKLILGKSDHNDQLIVEYLRELQHIPLLYGRPRSILRLLDLDKTLEIDPGNRIKATAVLLSGDNLYKDQKEKLEHWFNCDIYNAYMSSEGGAIAMSCKYNNGLHLISEKAFLEVLNSNTGNINASGKGLAVVTNLENWAMPFIRYLTDDEILVEKYSCSCGYQGYSIRAISGRDSTYFVFNGKLFNPSLINSVFEALPVKMFQVLQQKDEALIIKWIPERDCHDQERVSLEMHQEIAAITGAGQISVEAVNQIGTEGAKVQRYVCKVPKT